MVAKQVDVISRSYPPRRRSGQVVGHWRDELHPRERSDKDVRGTEVVIHLKDDEKEFTRGFRIKDIIRRHSDYVAFPIYVG